MTGICRLLFALLVLLPGSARASRIYRFPIVPVRAPSLRALTPLPPVQDVAVWNLFGEGHFSGVRTTFHRLENGQYRRGSSERVNILQGLAPQSAQDCGQALIDGSIMKRIEHGAFSDMERDGYLPPGGYGAFLEIAHGFVGEQMTYFESLTWLSAAQTLAIFGGRIPWERVAEIEGPDVGVQPELKALTEAGSDQIRVRIRRASLALVAGQFLTPPPGTSLANFLPRGHLPFESDPDFHPHALSARWHRGLQFELTRAAQLEGLFGEVDDLARFALAVAAHQSFALPVPSEDPWVFTSALDRRRRIFFERKLDVDPVLEIGEKTLLRGSLDTLLAKQTPTAVVESLARVRAAVGPKVPERTVIELLQRYRRTFRRDLDFREGLDWKEDFTHPDGAIVNRDHSPLFRLRYASQVQPVADHFGFEFEALWTALQGREVLETPAQFVYFRRDAGVQEWRRWGISPIAFSNLSPHLAQNPAYVRKFLIAVTRSWGLEDVLRLAGDPLTVAVSSHDAAIGQQLQAAGLRSLGEGNYAIELEDLQGRVREWPEFATSPPRSFFQGYWADARTLYDLEGL